MRAEFLIRRSRRNLSDGLCLVVEAGDRMGGDWEPGRYVGDGPPPCPIHTLFSAALFMASGCAAGGCRRRRLDCQFRVRSSITSGCLAAGGNDSLTRQLDYYSMYVVRTYIWPRFPLDNGTTRSAPCKW